MPKFDKLDPVIHAPVRLAVMTLLSQVVKADFNYIKDATETTDGNLSTHLSKLEKVEFISIEKSFSGKKPLTMCAITNKGKNAYRSYLRSLQSYLQKGK
ncbi:MAG: transcriptional regulator [Candidatus Marinimicrobia bacterium]|jgi:DNA-binding PadR family transcriptional regulator|nr:transcriptional regulator [Candidatus Neomarinimicrobiota bacterium]MBT3675075.1 transcriptional regulator [Candidatus Neomarinimicrobiota bacterium]MBT3763598.1 transcriptional regulator [Candidatus Neomarinimicrobiota bacterium]MBT4069589.1 transcriptional regulator [Candidatus Neomarinimicrobiota bacterium]MBT4270267.1 transcriptional regulator [Candidatus Neomarinimicrobiota bacterium]